MSHRNNPIWEAVGQDSWNQNVILQCTLVYFVLLAVFLFAHYRLRTRPDFEVFAGLVALPGAVLRPAAVGAFSCMPRTCFEIHRVDSVSQDFVLKKPCLLTTSVSASFDFLLGSVMEGWMAVGQDSWN